MNSVTIGISKEEIEELQIEINHLHFKMMRSKRQQNFMDADNYEAEMDLRIEQLEKLRNQ
jgi:hypothetical protein